ncbi:MAG: transposase [Legionella sp.]
MYHNISEELWDKIYAYLLGKKGLHVKNEERLRRFMEGVWYVLRTGCQWRLLPYYYGHWRQIHRPYKSWSDRGIWSELMSFVSDVDPQAVMIDATIVRAHACASGYVKDGNEAQALGRSKGYDSQELIDTLHNQDCSSVIPSRKNAVCPREIDRELYKERFLIEVFFSKLKQFRRIFSRFDKTISDFSGFLHLAGAIIWMR